MGCLQSLQEITQSLQEIIVQILDAGTVTCALAALTAKTVSDALVALTAVNVQVVLGVLTAEDLSCAEILLAFLVIWRLWG